MDTSSLPQLVNYWVLQTLAVTLTALLIPRLRITSLFGATAMAGAIALVNATVWNAGLFSFIPSSLSSHALTLLLANGFIFWLLVKLLPGIESDGILPCLIAPIVFTVCSVFINEFGRDIDWISVGTKIWEWIVSVRDSLMGPAAPTK